VTQTRLPEAVKAREVSRTYDSTELFDDIIYFYLSDDATAPDDLKKALETSLK
jgi:hypothetical protein